MKFPTFNTERKNLRNYDFVIGVDEVGVGPLCGPVVAAACILNPKTIPKKRTKNCWYENVRDSKKTKEKERQILLRKILENSLAFGVGEASAKEIDKINIHQASLLCKKRAIEKLVENLQTNKINLKNKKALILVDGLYTIPGLEFNFSFDQKSFVKGDNKILTIASASIIAKVHRDNFLHKLHKKFPEYGFDKHKGYGTKLHREKIILFGSTIQHRKTFLKNIV